MVKLLALKSRGHGLILGFYSLTDETLNRDPASYTVDSEMFART